MLFQYLARKIAPFIEYEVDYPVARPTRINLPFITAGHGDLVSLGDGEQETFATVQGGLTLLQGYYRMGHGGSWGDGHAYEFVVPPDYQPNPWVSIWPVAGVITFQNILNSGRVLSVHGILEFHQANYPGSRFVLRGRFPHDGHLNKPDFAAGGTELFRPRWPHSLRPGDSFKFSAAYANHWAEPE